MAEENEVVLITWPRRLNLAFTRWQLSANLHDAMNVARDYSPGDEHFKYPIPSQSLQAASHPYHLCKTIHVIVQGLVVVGGALSFECQS